MDYIQKRKEQMRNNGYMNKYGITSEVVDVMIEDGRDDGWACGPTTGYIATKLEKPDEVYMIGHDLVSDTNTVNNIYKSTHNYVASEFEPTPSGNWELQWKRLMELNPKIKFFKVNKELNDSPTNRKIDVFTAQEDINLEYIDQAQLLDRLS